MKNFFFFSVFVLSALVSNAQQWTTNGNNITNTNSGYIGIGTSTPYTKLYVKSANPGSGYVDWAAGTFGAQSGDNVSIGLLNGVATIASLNSVFSAYTNLALNPYGGKLGLGTATPTAQVHFVPASDLNPANVNSTNFDGRHFAVGTVGNSASALAFSKKTESGGSAYITSATISQSWDPLGFQAGNYNWFTGGNTTPKMVLSNTGNLGVGTASPTSNLEVFAGASNTASGLVLSQGTTGGNINSGRLFFSNLGDITTNSFAILKNGNGLLFNYGANAGISSGTSALIMTNGGLVGIGTSAPDAKLAVKGTIHASEVKVDLNVPGPDYVFEKNYRLPELTAIKNYIDKNKHLPEIPSAKEMEKGGINLSEMNMLLLKKVEELTLYLIEKDKKDNEKDELLASLQKQINDLKKSK